MLQNKEQSLCTSMECILLDDGSIATSIEEVSPLASLIFREDWKGLIKYLDTEEGMLEGTKRTNGYTRNKGQNVIHLICSFNPPLDVVQRLVEMNPGALNEIDDNGQTPLHMSVACGAPFCVVSFLVQQNSRAASMQDTSGKTPLHLACDRGYLDCSRTEVKNKILTMQALTCAAPDSLLKVDENGVSVLENAILQDANYELVRALQMLTARALKKIPSRRSLRQPARQKLRG